METLQHIILWCSIGGIVLAAIVWLAVAAFPALRHLRWVLFLFAAGMILYGGAKGGRTGTVSFPTVGEDSRYLINRGSFVTNDYVHIDFTTLVIPGSANLFVYRRELGETNDLAWVEHLATTIAAFDPPQDLQFPAATNYNWIVFSDWTPGSAVETNGVWHTYWGLDRKAHIHIIPIRTAIRVDDTVIATPKSKAESERNDQ